MTPAKTAERRPRLAGRPLALAGSALAVLLVAAGVAGFFWLRGSDGPMSAPSCSWPLRVRGHPEDGQAGLVRCYLRALADRSVGGLLAVADTANVPVRITEASFAHAPDARSGLATATFIPNQIASGVSDVSIAFADGGRESLEIDLANPNSGTSWRLLIGSQADRQSPPPAASSRS
jgi:hypothetical protein